jgi:aminoglycoside phosphotransferase (APT) family kinase protein
VTFKQNWEKADQHYDISPQSIEGMVALAFPQNKLASHEVISGGCANLNIKITLQDKEQLYILRVYLRDKDAAYVEQKLGVLLKDKVPIPQIYFVGDLDAHRFSVAEFMPGITLRDLLLGDEACDMEELMREAGEILGRIQTIRFSISGFFSKDLTIQEPLTQDGYVSFAKDCLKHPTVIHILGEESISKIDHLLDVHAVLFPDETQTHLVHGDFDPANLLVKKSDGFWKISGVLDWEFAYCASPLQDVALMLRYAHHMPTVYEAAFLSGLQNGGVELPDDWRLRIDLLNILNLLSCLVRSAPDQHPNRCADICDLINNILSRVISNDESIKWAQNYLTANGYEIQDSPETVRAMPWSVVTRFSTSKGSIYLKEMATLFSLEPTLIRTLSEWDDGTAPRGISINKDLRCFLMEDAGIQLSTYLKTNFQIDLLAKAVTMCAKSQYKAVNHVDVLLSIGVLDWRLVKLPNLYLQLLNQEAILRDDGLTAAEIKVLRTLHPTISTLCDRLSQYKIPETLEHTDFHDSNILIKDGCLTIGDWGDAVISHPFFSLVSYLNSVTRYYDVKETDERYVHLQSVYLNAWLEFASKDHLIEAFQLAKRLRPCQVALSFIRVKMCPNLESSFRFTGYIAAALRDFIQGEVGD